MAKKRNEERNGENAEGEEPNFEDPEDFVDDISEQGEHLGFISIQLAKLVDKKKCCSASLNDSVASV